MPKFPPPFDFQVQLENDLVILRPLTEVDFEPLYEVAKDPLIWEQHPNPDRYKRFEFKLFFEDALYSNATLAVIDKSTKVLIGSSRFKAIEGEGRAVEIGWSFLARKYWGGQYNQAVKNLMMAHAFQTVEVIVFYIGKNNIRSQKAVRKLGAIRDKSSPFQHKNSDNWTYTIDSMKAQNRVNKYSKYTVSDDKK